MLDEDQHCAHSNIQRFKDEWNMTDLLQYHHKRDHQLIKFIVASHYLNSAILSEL